MQKPRKLALIQGKGAGDSFITRTRDLAGTGLRYNCGIMEDPTCTPSSFTNRTVCGVFGSMTVGNFWALCRLVVGRAVSSLGGGARRAVGWASCRE